MNAKHIEDRLREYRWPEISPAVRQRVLSAAVLPSERITWSDRVWFSRAWRLSAAAVVVMLLAVDQLTGAARPSLSATPQVMAEAQAIENAATEVGLPTQTAEWLARRSVAEASRPRTAPRPGAALLLPLELETAGGM